MNFVPDGYTHFKRFSFGQSIKDIFLLEVDKGFENNIAILDGGYGKWFTEQEIFYEPKLIDEDKLVLKEFYEFLRVRE